MGWKSYLTHKNVDFLGKNMKKKNTVRPKVSQIACQTDSSGYSQYRDLNPNDSKNKPKGEYTMKKMPSLDKVLSFIQLLVFGAVIGLYLAKLLGFSGINITPSVDTLGASVGAVSIVVLKLIHLV